jgi:hypothetical protein
LFIVPMEISGRSEGRGAWGGDISHCRGRPRVATGCHWVAREGGSSGADIRAVLRIAHGLSGSYRRRRQSPSKGQPFGALTPSADAVTTGAVAGLASQQPAEGRALVCARDTRPIYPARPQIEYSRRLVTPNGCRGGPPDRAGGRSHRFPPREHALKTSVTAVPISAPSGPGR